MAIITWEDSLLVGIEEIDQHHRHLVELLNRAFDDFTGKGSVAGTGAILEELYDYATYHFNREEEVMADLAYPKMAEHVAEHRRFSQRVTEMHKDYLEGRGTIALEMLTFLKNWLVNHISQVDAELGAYAAARSKPAGFEFQL